MKLAFQFEENWSTHVLKLEGKGRSREAMSIFFENLVSIKKSNYDLRLLIWFD